MRDRDFGWTVEMQVKARRHGLRVREVPVDYRPRIGRSKVSGTLSRQPSRGREDPGHHRAPRLDPGDVMQRAGLIAAGAALSACVAAWASQGDQTTAHRVPPCALRRRVRRLPRRARVRAGTRRRAAWAWRSLTAAAWRVALVATPPLVSDDVNRSVWEGRIQLHGGNPYAWSDRPEAARWTPLRDDVWTGMNHRDYTAVYPPLWQLVARAIAAISDSVVAFKAFLAACELLALWPLATILRRRGRPRERLLVLAWSPLALVEIAGGGHNEALGLLLLALSWAAIESGRPLASAVAAALGAQVKLLPAADCAVLGAPLSLVARARRRRGVGTALPAVPGRDWRRAHAEPAVRLALLAIQRDAVRAARRRLRARGRGRASGSCSCAPWPPGSPGDAPTPPSPAWP